MMNSEKEKTKSTLFEDIFIKDYTYMDMYTKKDIWQELEKILNGKFTIIHTKSNDLNSFHLDFEYNSIKIMMVETDIKPLKFEIELNLKQPFEFNISWEDNVDKLLKFLGKNEVEIGNKEFDSKYLIKATDKTLTQNILNKAGLISQILKTNTYIINCSYNTLKESTEILTVANRNVKSIEELLEFVKVQFLFIESFIDNDLIKN